MAPAACPRSHTASGIVSSHYQPGFKFASTSILEFCCSPVWGRADTCRCAFWASTFKNDIHASLFKFLSPFQALPTKRAAIERTLTVRAG